MRAGTGRGHTQGSHVAGGCSSTLALQQAVAVTVVLHT